MGRFLEFALSLLAAQAIRVFGQEVVRRAKASFRLQCLLTMPIRQ
jgi:hypothetical protein